MRKRLTMALAAGALVAAMVPGVASAGGPPVGGCPNGWGLGFLYGVRDQVDVNGDGRACYKSGDGKPAIVDNHLPLG